LAGRPPVSVFYITYKPGSDVIRITIWDAASLPEGTEGRNLLEFADRALIDTRISALEALTTGLGYIKAVAAAFYDWQSRNSDEARQAFEGLLGDVKVDLDDDSDGVPV